MNRFLALLPLLGACTGASGTYLIEIPAIDPGDCTTTIDENYSDADPFEDAEDPDSPWTYTETVVGSPGVVVAEVIQSTGGEHKAVMFVGDAILYGVKNAGAWDFSWTNSTVSEETGEHEDGYEVSQKTDSNSTQTISLLFKDYTATIKFDSENTQAYVESDEWDPTENGVAFSQIPSGTYLDGDTNAADNDDCSGSDCELTIKSVCSTSVATKFSRAKTSNDSAFDGVKDASQGSN